MATLAINSPAFENMVSECFHFQRLAGVENAGTPMCRGNANRSAFLQGRAQRKTPTGWAAFFCFFQYQKVLRSSTANTLLLWR